MSNTITIELCAEDRARLDRIADRLEAQIQLTQYLLDHGVSQPKQTEPDELTAKLQAIVDGAKNATEEAEEITPPTTHETEEQPTQAEEPPATASIQQVSRAEFGAKVREMMTKGFKEQTKAIVQEYAPTVPRVPEDKVTECYNRLVALEG